MRDRVLRGICRLRFGRRFIGLKSDQATVKVNDHNSVIDCIDDSIARTIENQPQHRAQRHVVKRGVYWGLFRGAYLGQLSPVDKDIELMLRAKVIDDFIQGHFLEYHTDLFAEHIVCEFGIFIAAAANFAQDRFHLGVVLFGCSDLQFPAKFHNRADLTARLRPGHARQIGCP